MVTHYTPGGLYKGQVSAKMPLNGDWDKVVLTQVNDPSKDLFATYQLNSTGT